MTIKDLSPYNIVSEGLKELKENERKVVAGRFGIDVPHRTLSSIGRELKLSRERIRQIEKDSLKKLANKVIEQHHEEIERIAKSFQSAGGVAATNQLAEKFLDEAYRGDVNQFNSLNLIFFVMPQIKKIKKTKEIEEGWILAQISRSEAIKVIDEWANHLKKKCAPESLEILLKAHPHHSKYEVTFLSELPSISKKIVKTEEGHVGLSSWSEINPRNIRDKIYYVLKKANKPLHFEDIANKIKDQGFDRKGVVKATVHNELIADSRFVLVGRGVYALKEWGFKPGTVADIIKDILRDKHDGMVLEEIMHGVLEQRVVKRNTVLINLKTKSDFKRVGEDKYALAK